MIFYLFSKYYHGIWAKGHLMIDIHLLAQILINPQAFEELLRANDIDYYMGQSFREQLAQSTALAQRVVTKISGRKKHHLINPNTQTATSCFTVLHSCGLLPPK